MFYKLQQEKKVSQDVMEETMSQPSVQLPHLPDDIIPYHQPFPPPPPSAFIKRGAIEHPVERKGMWVRDSMYDELYPSDQESVWFSCAERYAKIEALSSTSDELKLSQTHPIIKFWSSVLDAKFAGELDAFLPHPNNKEEMYVFCGDSMVKIDTASSLSFSLLLRLHCSC